MASPTFASPILIGTGTDVSRPVVAADSGGGYAYVAYINNDVSPSEVYMATSSNSGASFAAPVNITNNTGTSINPSLAVDPSGYLYFAWQDTTAGNYEAMFARSTDHGASFGAPVDVAPSAQGSLYIVIAVDADQNIYMAWDDNRVPPDPEGTTNQANFEIFTVAGREGLPVVQNPLANPDIVSPNGDGTNDTVTFSATFTETIDWQLEIRDASDTVVFSTSGSGSSMSYVWDGQTASNQTVADGTYRYTISGVGQGANAYDAVAAGGSFIVNTVASNTAPAINCFSREASSFSPNIDGFKDSIGINAEFNKPLDWTFTIEDESQVTVRTITGNGLIVDTRWDGTDSNGQTVAEGNYKLKLSATDGTTTVSANLSTQVDTVPPELTTLYITPTTFSPNGDGVQDLATIHGLPSETALVTIYVYESNGTLVRELSRAYRNPDDGEFTLDWDGRDDNNNLVVAGTYTIKVWCRDLGGNVAVTYPYYLDVIVQ